ncbi:MULTISPECIES: hypothetical protein [Bacillus cereus group]|nr:MULTISPECIES: hypothetical protein [Bacillus cereus group]EEM56749.1 hypothetical protein bthur0007_53830 [Bacillus thuringiensis serovar monterrey BGSC 4AJ1]MEB9674056.1 hypothetical protein [Bacillus anthracis]
MSSLKEQVKQICNRLAPHGWGELLYAVNLFLSLIMRPVMLIRIKT